MQPISMFKEMLSGLSHWMHRPAVDPQMDPTIKLMLTKNPNSTSVQVRLLSDVVYCVCDCIPMEFPDGLANTHCYPHPPLLFLGCHHNMGTRGRISSMCSHAYDLKAMEENSHWVQMTWHGTSLEFCLRALHFVPPGQLHFTRGDCFLMVDIFLFH